MKFDKLHGLGNDYVIVDEREEIKIEEVNKSGFARKTCRRGNAVGADGLLYISNFQSGIRMRIFNADGSEAETCGNGLRCAAYFHHGLESEGQSSFEIDLPLADVVQAEVSVDSPPVASVTLQLNEAGKYQGEASLEIEGWNFKYHYVDVGNPHAVVFLDENPELPHTPGETAVKEIGSPVQSHRRFSETNGINVEFVRTKSTTDYRMRVFERGVGETSACGTGSIAVARAAAETERADTGWVTVSQPGGELEIETAAGLLRGPATWVYSGDLAP